MSQAQGLKIADARRMLVERVNASKGFSRPARLRALFQYLTERVFDDPPCEVREHEIGYQVFNRPLGYDTTADDIVRVHASMLRKRLEQFFQTEGVEETRVIEIPHGNYAPVFRERPKALTQPRRTDVVVRVPAVEAHPSAWI